MDESERLICLAALAEPVTAQAAWNEWRAHNNPADASALLTWAGGYIHRNLMRVGRGDPYLAGIARHNWLTNNLKLARATPLLTEIAARWEIVPLKSFGLGEDKESRRLRPLADIDFYVKQTDALEISAELVRRRFTPLLDADADEFRDRIVTQRGSWNFVSQNADIDVHWKIMDHLDLATNRRLLAQWSQPAQTAYGHVRLLQPEATLALLATHHVLQESGRLSGIFDVFETAKRVDPTLTRRFAEETGTIDVLRSVVNEAIALGAVENTAVERLRETLESSSHAAPARMAVSPVPAPATAKTPTAFPADELQEARLSRPRLYRWWFSRRADELLERRLLRIFGPFGNRRIALDPSGTTTLIPATARDIGPGWHHLFPGDTWRWAGNPDSRLTFVGVKGGGVRLTINLKAADWRVHTPGDLGIYANGMLVGHANRDQSSIECDATDAVIRGFLEVSLRLISVDRTPIKGILSHRNQLLAPVISVVLSTPGI